MRFETTETLPKYFSEIDKVADFLTKDQERSLARIIQENGPNATKAINDLVKPNLKFVVTIANNFIGMGLPISDLIQEGNLGLLEAAIKYKSENNTKFLTYAAFWIRKRLNLALCNYGRTVRLPVNQEYQMYKDKQRGISKNLSNVEIDATVSEDNNTSKGDYLFNVDFDDPFKYEEQDRIITVLLGLLNPKERIVIELFYGLFEYTAISTKEIAMELNMSTSEVNRALKTARNKMRQKVK